MSKILDAAELNEGDLAPDFDLPLDELRRISLSALRGKKVALYFYPKDDTSGCTAEAIAFNRLKRDFEAAGAVVVGVSPDSAASHKKFKSKHELDIALAADPEQSGLAGLRGVEREEHVRPQVHGGRAHDGADRPRRQDPAHLAQSESSGPCRRGPRRGAGGASGGAFCEGLTLIMSKSREGFAKCASPEGIACFLVIPDVERSCRARISSSRWRAVKTHARLRFGHTQFGR